MKYSVKMEFDVKSIDLLNVEVEASSRKEAIAKAIKMYQEGDTDDDVYASDYYDVTMASNSVDWEVDEIEASQ